MNFQRYSLVALTCCTTHSKMCWNGCNRENVKNCKTSKHLSFLLKGDNTVGPKDRNLFLLCGTFNFLPESDFCSLIFLLALFFYVHKHISLFSCSFKLQDTQYLKINFSKLTTNFHGKLQSSK